MALLPHDWRDALVGDLREEAARAPTGAHVLYWREVVFALIGVVVRIVMRPVRGQQDAVCKEESMSVTGTATNRSAAFILSLGVLGGGALITTAAVSHRGPLVFLPYAAIVIISAVILRAEAVQPFSRRFLLGLGAFMLATLIFYLFVAKVSRGLTEISILGHAWRIGLMVVIGSILSAAVAQLTGTRNTTEPAS